MFVKLTSGFAGIPLVSRNLVLQELWRTGSYFCNLPLIKILTKTVAFSFEFYQNGTEKYNYNKNRVKIFKFAL